MNLNTQVNFATKAHKYTTLTPQAVILRRVVVTNVLLCILKINKVIKKNKSLKIKIYKSVIRPIVTY